MLPTPSIPVPFNIGLSQPDPRTPPAQEPLCCPLLSHRCSPSSLCLGLCVFYQELQGSWGFSRDSAFLAPEGLFNHAHISPPLPRHSPHPAHRHEPYSSRRGSWASGLGRTQGSSPLSSCTTQGKEFHPEIPAGNNNSCLSPALLSNHFPWGFGNQEASPPNRSPALGSTGDSTPGSPPQHRISNTNSFSYNFHACIAGFTQDQKKTPCTCSELRTR